MAATSSSPNRFYLLIGGLAVVGALALYFLSRQGHSPTIPVAVAVTAGDTAGFRGYVLGSADAPVEIMEFADYQCPACEKFEMVEFPYVLERLINTGRVRYVYRDFPLDQPHKWARLAAHAAACANDQGKFWEVHGGIYATQTEWSFSSRAGNQFREIAGKQGLDLDSYDECMGSLRYAGRLQGSLDEGLRMGVNSTPTFVIGGGLYLGVLPYDRIKALVDSLSPLP
ncbi:MAG: thioredoxin domain-containing protein [Gemmatimonadota bacterium]